MTRSRRLHLQIFHFSIFATLALATQMFAQSTNPLSPTPLNGSYNGKGPGKETSYYFSFTGGPGEVSVQLEIKAKDYSTFARLEIGNGPSNLIAMANMNASTATGPSSVVKKFKLSDQQPVRIRLTLDGNLAEYTLSVNGASATGSSGGGNKLGTIGKTGKITSVNGAKMTAAGSSGNKLKVDKQSSKGEKGEITITCPTEIYYQLVPIADWDGGLFGKKLYKFDSAGVDGNMVSCTYTVNNTTRDSATIMRYAPTGYKCSVYSSGSKNRLVLCKSQEATMDE